MGQKTAVDRLPKELRTKVLSMIEDPALMQVEIMEKINTEAGEEFLSKSSLNRFVKRVRSQKERAGMTSAENSLFRIANALERIAKQLEKS